MNPKRLLLIAATSMSLLAAYAGATLVMDRLARRVEVVHEGYLWSNEEWMQLFGVSNFVDRGRGRILLTGSSEAREGFLFDEFEAEIPGFDVYNNAFANHTLQTLLIVLQYIESVYGSAAMPQKLVVGVTLPFLLNQPSLDRSYLPRVIDRYSPFVSLDVVSQPPRLIRKGWRDSLIARYRYLTHQSRRYKEALRSVMRACLLTLAPRLADRQWMRGAVPSKYHHRPPIDQGEQLQAMRRILPPLTDFPGRAAAARMEWARLQDLLLDHGIDLYVVNMPQSTFLLDDYYAETYDGYQQLLRSVTGDVPMLDLSHFLRDEEFRDVTHANLAAARRISRRVAQFVRDTEAASPGVTRPNGQRR